MVKFGGKVHGDIFPTKLELYIALKCGGYVATGPVIKWRIHHLVFLYIQEYCSNENVFDDFITFYHGPWSNKLDGILNKEKYFKYCGNREYIMTNKGYKTLLELEEKFSYYEDKFKEFFDNYGAMTYREIQGYIKNNYSEYYPKHFDLPI